jgi:hypothetical protein
MASYISPTVAAYWGVSKGETVLTSGQGGFTSAADNAKKNVTTANQKETLTNKAKPPQETAREPIKQLPGVGSFKQSIENKLTTNRNLPTLTEETKGAIQEQRAAYAARQDLAWIAREKGVPVEAYYSNGEITQEGKATLAQLGSQSYSARYAALKGTPKESFAYEGYTTGAKGELTPYVGTGIGGVEGKIGIGKAEVTTTTTTTTTTEPPKINPLANYQYSVKNIAPDLSPRVPIKPETETISIPNAFGLRAPYTPGKLRPDILTEKKEAIVVEKEESRLFGKVAETKLGVPLPNMETKTVVEGSDLYTVTAPKYTAKAVNENTGLVGYTAKAFGKEFTGFYSLNNETAQFRIASELDRAYGVSQEQRAVVAAKSGLGTLTVEYGRQLLVDSPLFAATKFGIATTQTIIAGGQQLALGELEYEGYTLTGEQKAALAGYRREEVSNVVEPFVVPVEAIALSKVDVVAGKAGELGGSLLAKAGIRKATIEAMPVLGAPLRSIEKTALERGLKFTGRAGKMELFKAYGAEVGKTVIRAGVVGSGALMGFEQVPITNIQGEKTGQYETKYNYAKGAAGVGGMFLALKGGEAVIGGVSKAYEFAGKQSPFIRTQLKDISQVRAEQAVGKYSEKQIMEFKAATEEYVKGTSSKLKSAKTEQTMVKARITQLESKVAGKKTPLVKKAKAFVELQGEKNQEAKLGKDIKFYTKEVEKFSKAPAHVTQLNIPGSKENIYSVRESKPKPGLKVIETGKDQFMFIKKELSSNVRSIKIEPTKPSRRMVGEAGSPLNIVKNEQGEALGYHTTSGKPAGILNERVTPKAGTPLKTAKNVKGELIGYEKESTITKPRGILNKPLEAGTPLKIVRNAKGQPVGLENMPKAPATAAPQGRGFITTSTARTMPKETNAIKYGAKSQLLTKEAVKPNFLAIGAKPIQKANQKSLTMPATSLASKLTSKQETQTTTKQTTKQQTKQLTKELTKTQTKVITKPVTKQITQTITKPITKLTTTTITRQITRQPPNLILYQPKAQAGKLKKKNKGMLQLRSRSISGNRFAYADLFSVSKSQYLYGRATSPGIQRAETRRYIAGYGGRLKTVELMKNKAKTYKSSKGYKWGL